MCGWFRGKVDAKGSPITMGNLKWLEATAKHAGCKCSELNFK